MNNSYNPFLDIITEKKGKEVFWQVVDDILKFLSRHPNKEIRQEIIDDLWVAELKRSTRQNQYASTADKSRRALGQMPRRLVKALDKIYPDGLPMTDKEFIRGFFTRYPAFRVTDKI